MGGASALLCLPLEFGAFLFMVAFLFNFAAFFFNFVASRSLALARDI